MLSVKKSNRQFFDTFDAMAAGAVEASQILEEMFRNGIAASPGHAGRIKDIEHRCDNVVHDLVRALHSTFITPLDREDIHLLASRLDDVIDLIDGTARRLQLFHAGAAPDGAMLIAEVIVRATEQLQVAVAALEKNKNGTVLNACVQIKRLEEEGDTLYHEWLGRLFEGSPDALTVIKWKEIYDNLEDAIDRCEDVANVIEGVALEYS